MNHVVPCPSCSHKLSVPDEVVGRTVRCPVCQTAFEAAAPSGPAPPPVPPLSLDDAAAPEAPALPRNLWGAVEIEASGGAPPPLPRASDPDPPEPPRPRRRDEDARARRPARDLPDRDDPLVPGGGGGVLVVLSDVPGPA